MVRGGLFISRTFHSQNRTFFCWSRTFFYWSRTFLVGGELFQSPPVTKKSSTPTKKSSTPTEKSSTVISKRCWTLEYSGELEFSSPFMEQWTLDARGVLWNIPVDLSSQVHLWSSGLWMLEEYYIIDLLLYNRQFLNQKKNVFLPTAHVSTITNWFYQNL